MWWLNEGNVVAHWLMLLGTTMLLTQKYRVRIWFPTQSPAAESLDRKYDSETVTSHQLF
jgi:hypothetical protein